MGPPEFYLPNYLVGKASGAVVDRRSSYIGLVIEGEECSFSAPDTASFDRAIGMLSLAGVPIHEVQSLRTSFWLIVAIGLLVIVAVSLFR